MQPCPQASSGAPGRLDGAGDGSPREYASHFATIFSGGVQIGERFYSLTGVARGFLDEFLSGRFAGERAFDGLRAKSLWSKSSDSNGCLLDGLTALGEQDICCHSDDGEARSGLMQLLISRAR